MADEEYLTLFGMYVLQPAIFEYLDENIRHNLTEFANFAKYFFVERAGR